MKDSLFELKYIIKDLNSSRDLNEATKKWLKSWNILKNSRFIISLENEESNFPKILSDISFLDKSYIKTLFKYNNFYCLDKDVINLYGNNKDAIIRLDYSISFDTNFTSYINSYINCKNLGENNTAFISTIDHIVNHDVNYDYSFYILENNKKIYDDKYKKIIFDNLVSIRKLETIDKNHYFKTREIKSLLSDDRVNSDCDRKFSYYSSRNGKKFINEMNSFNLIIYLILLKMCHIQYFDTKCNSKNTKMKEFVRFMHFDIGCLLERELIAGFYFFSDPQKIPVLNKLKPNSKKLLENIRNTSWDFSLLRYMEFFTSTFTSKFHYFIPCFLSFDKYLVDLFDVNPIKSCFIDKKYGNYFMTVNDTADILSQLLDNNFASSAESVGRWTVKN